MYSEHVTLQGCLQWVLTTKKGPWIGRPTEAVAKCVYESSNLPRYAIIALHMLRLNETLFDSLFFDEVHTEDIGTTPPTSADRTSSLIRYGLTKISQQLVGGLSICTTGIRTRVLPSTTGQQFKLQLLHQVQEHFPPMATAHGCFFRLSATKSNMVHMVIPHSHWWMILWTLFVRCAPPPKCMLLGI